MLSIQLNKLGKKFNREWIFKDLTYTIAGNQKLLISGGNGSGKSTLLQVLSGFVAPNAGTVDYLFENKKLSFEKTKDYISFASPYLQLIEDFTLKELVDHVRVYKRFASDCSTADFIDRINLKSAKDKYVKQFSSGMKQRLKLGLAILSATPLLLLDEPVSNLDKEAIAWYKQLLLEHLNERTIIVCSNAINDEHFFCDTEIKVEDFKKAH